MHPRFYRLQKVQQQPCGRRPCGFHSRRNSSTDWPLSDPGSMGRAVSLAFDKEYCMDYRSEQESKNAFGEGDLLGLNNRNCHQTNRSEERLSERLQVAAQKWSQVLYLTSLTIIARRD